MNTDNMPISHAISDMPSVYYATVIPQNPRTHNHVSIVYISTIIIHLNHTQQVLRVQVNQLWQALLAHTSQETAICVLRLLLLR